LFAREIVDDCFQDCKMADPATKVGGAISVIFGILVLLRVHYYKRD